MNDIPRQKLREIIKRYGLTLIDDPRRVRALLLDHCGQYRREIFVLVQAQEEAVAEDLLEIPDSVPLAMLLSQLTHRLISNRALSPDAARWSVESWAYALGKPIRFSNGIQDQDSDNAEAEILNAPGQTPAVSENAKKSSPANQSPVLSQFIPFDSDWPVDFYWRDIAQTDFSWSFLGQTPGKVLLPANGMYKLIPHIAGDDLKAWASEFTYPDKVISLGLDRPVSDLGFSVLNDFTKVQDLTVDNGESLSNQGFAHIQDLHAVENLRLTWCTRVEDSGYAHFTSLKQLSDIKLEWAQITDKGCQSFESLPNLTHLGLRECKKLRGDGLRFVQKNKAITSLDLTGASNLEDRGLEYIGEMKWLNKLNLSHCTHLSEQGLSSLRHLENLAYLNLDWVPALKDDTIERLSGLDQLTSLSLSHTGITNGGLAKLKSIQTLAYLDLSGCDSITDRGLKNIVQLPNITHLNLNGCKRLSTRGIDRLERTGLTILR